MASSAQPRRGPPPCKPRSCPELKAQTTQLVAEHNRSQSTTYPSGLSDVKPVWLIFLPCVAQLFGSVTYLPFILGELVVAVWFVFGSKVTVKREEL